MVVVCNISINCLVLHGWEPLFANSEISGAEQKEASRERKSVGATLMNTVEAARSVPAPGFSDVQVEDLPQKFGQHQQKLTIEEMLEDEQQEEYDTRSHPRNLMCSAPTKVMEEYKALYMFRVNACQQALIARYLCKAQPVINTLANITFGDDDGTIDDDIEVLGDLMVEELPQDFDGFDAEVRGGSREEAVTSPSYLGTHQPAPSSISLIPSSMWISGIYYDGYTASSFSGLGCDYATSCNHHPNYGLGPLLTRNMFLTL
ncbi:hypothetical protein Hamer_G000072 [Homarus americanus]|uniref:Uncharacterized protein n=1 Tax=Homarus americanus TaxID=6706 RepID=A0A8J5NCS8_HOMAM|nr:hypothetical protein Hamer_G000072 [Homarus americanus]